MKKKILTLGMVIVLMLSTSLNVMAAEKKANASVTLSANEKLEFDGNLQTEGGNVILGNSFENVAPGDTASQTITLKNENEHKVDFYMNANVVKALEDQDKGAKGAGYDIKLAAGNTTIYDSTAGGYAAANEGAASTTGIATMNDELGNTWILVGTLAKGQSQDVEFSIYLDGEAMDNANQSQYTEATGQVQFQFQASYKDPTGNQIIYKTVNKKGETKYVRNLVEIVEDAVPLAGAATGDNAMIGIGVMILAAGVVLILMATRKKKVEE